MIAGTSSSPLPHWIPPQLATLVPDVPDGPEWLHEVKYDGYRALCRIAGGKPRLISRNRRDITNHVPAIAAELAELPVTSAWLDGELCVLRENGTTSFGDLHAVFRERAAHPVVYFVFDLLYLDGRDLRPLPLHKRKSLLKTVVAGGAHLRLVDHIDGQGHEVYREACRLSLEGIVSKSRTAPYSSGRNRSWLKVKCRRTSDFIVGGFTESTGGNLFGSILAGLYQDGQLRFAGKVGTGFDAARRRTLLQAFRAYETATCPFVNPPSGPEYLNPHWLEPRLVAEVEYAELTTDGIRHASFKNIRELPDAAPAAPEPGSSRDSGALAVLKTDRIIYPHEKLRVGDLIDYYRVAAPLILLHLVRRPLSLVICPNNIKACRYKKHAGRLPPSILRIPIPGHDEDYIALDSIDALLDLVAIGTVEFHGWGSRWPALDFADRLIFDLDPEENVPWEALAEAVLLVRSSLLDLGLESFLKTTGGKGYHVVVPVVAEKPWPVVTPFTRRFAERLAATYPDRLTAHHRKERRAGKIFIDWIRNGHGTNAIEPWSARARHGAPVAVPIGWEELVAGTRPDDFTLANIAERIETVGNTPWAAFFDLRQQVPDG